MKWTLLLGLVGLFTQCVPSTSSDFTAPTSDAKPISHEIWNGLLKTYVDAEGLVDYAALKANDARTLDQYLTLVSTHAPAADWSRDENWPTGSMRTTPSPSGRFWTSTPRRASSAISCSWCCRAGRSAKNTSPSAARR